MAGNGLGFPPGPCGLREACTGTESMMSLPACQQRALDRIATTLLAGDPRLGSLFGIFTRLTWHEAMPRIEQVKPGRWYSLRPSAGIAVMLITVLGVLVLSLLAPTRPTCVIPAAPGNSHSSSRTAGCLTGPAMMQEQRYIR
jgi:hypothetical protein